MTQLSALPSSPGDWVGYFERAFSIVDDALSDVAFSRHKCQLIANELGRFLSKLRQIQHQDFCPRERIQLFNFFKATTAFVGIVSSYQSNSWLSFFMNNEPDASYADLRDLWDAWSECSGAFFEDCFIQSDLLAYMHCYDLAEVRNVLARGLYDFPATVQDLVRNKLVEIDKIIRPPQLNSSAADINKSILTHDDWEVVKANIGRGGCAFVHLAKLKTSGKEVAVKEMVATQLSRRRIDYLKREINAMRCLHHPNLINMIGVTITPPFCICMAYYPNGSLDKLIQSSNFGPQLASNIALDMARALEYLHAQGMLHRDLKPQNVLMDKDNRAVICDFGLSRMASPVMTSEIGTINWMAPEIISPGKKYDNSIDVYAYGMILYEMATKETPFSNMKQVQIAANVLKGKRPQLPSTVPENLQGLIKRCWAQNRNERPSMHQIVAELETGTTLFEGANSTEFRQWARKTSPQHKDAMESISKEQSTSQKLISRVANLNAFDPLAIPTLNRILELKIEDGAILDNIINLATQTASPEVSELAITVLGKFVQSDKIPAHDLGNALLKLWDYHPNFVVSNLKTVAKKLEDRQGFIRTILTKKGQNSQTVDAIEAIAELEDLHVIFQYLDPFLIVQTLSFALTHFGPVKEMVPAAVTSYAALNLFLRTVVKDEKYQSMYLSDSDANKVESIVTMFNTGFFINSAKDLQFIIESLSTMLHKGGPGYVTLDLLNSGAKFPPVAQLISKMDFWSIIAQALESPRDDICNLALTLSSQLTFTEESIRKIWEQLVSCFTSTHNDAALKLIQQFIRQVPKLDITGFIIGLLTGLESDKAESYTHILFAFNFNTNICHLDKIFWRLISKEIPNLSTASTAAVALFALKFQSETQSNDVSYDFIGSLLSFLYKQTAPFSCITPVLQYILNMSAQVDVAVFLTHHHFIQYLHQLPLRYPNEQKVTNILLQYAAIFEAASDTLKSKG